MCRRDAQRIRMILPPLLASSKQTAEFSRHQTRCTPPEETCRNSADNRNKACSSSVTISLSLSIQYSYINPSVQRLKVSGLKGLVHGWEEFLLTNSGLTSEFKISTTESWSRALKSCTASLESLALKIWPVGDSEEQHWRTNRENQPWKNVYFNLLSKRCD